jgi:DNA-binding LacI/PurR family transcriptional regulator
MPNRPTAVFCADDFLAYGIIDAAAAAGLSVPGDLSVVGVDNSWASASRDPRLTTIDIPVEQIGRGSIEALMRAMEGAPIEDCRTAVPVTNLVERNTTGPLRRATA